MRGYIPRNPVLLIAGIFLIMFGGVAILSGVSEEGFKEVLLVNSGIMIALVGTISSLVGGRAL